MATVPGIWFPEIFKKVSSLPRIKSIRRFETISGVEFSEFSSSSTPFILKNAFPVFSETEVVQILLEKFWDHEIEIRLSRFEGAEHYIERKLEKIKLGEFLSKTWKKDARYYAGNNPIGPDQLAKLKLDFPKLYPKEFFNQTRMWLGPKGSITPLHKDIPDNFALNYFGRKRWILFSPADFPFLYMINPTPEDYPDLGVSQVDVANPDFNRFPTFSKASPIEITLQKGEMLYLPAGWGHYVENLEDSLLFNFWLLRDKSPAVLGRSI